ncbi:hypothetical protein ACFY3U_27545 [Micromonospora sp. NPDC000089]|uniref:hypothetical protein n=1 Tax=unclassified Micromonospora TaxID=2617518 RepID=UPI00369AC7CF
MNRWVLAVLVWRNRVRQEGLAQYLLRIGPLSMLNVFLLAAVFTTANRRSLDVDLLTDQYVYFIPLLALSAAVGTWEVELFAGLGEWYLVRPAWVWPTRLLSGAAECLVPVIFFVVLIVVSSDPHRWQDLVTALLMLVVFLLLGSALGFCLGFRHEKAVNNFLNVIIWVLGFGPGPFFGNDTSGLRVLFPGGFSLREEFAMEWIRLACLAFLAIALVYWGRVPRRQPFFAR